MARSPLSQSSGTRRVRPGSGGTETFVSYAPARIEHRISDEELNMLSELRKDNIVEIFWGCVGAVTGSLAGGLQALPKIGNPADPLQLTDLAQLLLLGIGLAVGCVMAFFWWQRSKKAVSIVDSIRNRPRQLVTPPPPLSAATGAGSTSGAPVASAGGPASGT